jgi:hypothetical protein
MEVLQKLKGRTEAKLYETIKNKWTLLRSENKLASGGTDTDPQPHFRSESVLAIDKEYYSFYRRLNLMIHMIMLRDDLITARMDCLYNHVCTRLVKLASTSQWGNTLQPMMLTNLERILAVEYVAYKVMLVKEVEQSMLQMRNSIVSARFSSGDGSIIISRLTKGGLEGLRRRMTASMVDVNRYRVMDVLRNALTAGDNKQSDVDALLSAHDYIALLQSAWKKLHDEFESAWPKFSITDTDTRTPFVDTDPNGAHRVWLTLSDIGTRLIDKEGRYVSHYGDLPDELEVLKFAAVKQRILQVSRSIPHGVIPTESGTFCTLTKFMVYRSEMENGIPVDAYDSWWVPLRPPSAEPRVLLSRLNEELELEPNSDITECGADALGVRIIAIEVRSSDDASTSTNATVYFYSHDKEERHRILCFGGEYGIDTLLTRIKPSEMAYEQTVRARRDENRWFGRSRWDDPERTLARQDRRYEYRL